MEKSLPVNVLVSRTLRRLTTDGVQCGLLSLLAFLPLAGLTLLSPEQLGEPSQREYVLSCAVMARFLTPLGACLIVTYLARKDGLLNGTASLWSLSLRRMLPSIALVLAVAFFTVLATLLLVVPGVGFLLGSSIGLCVLVVEGHNVPESVRMSWERTRDVRSQLLGFWAIFLAASLGLLAATALFFTKGHLRELWEMPLAQSAALLPLVLVSSLLYGALVMGSYELYRLVSGRQEEAGAF